jgi:hypothetical protein
LEFLLVLSHDEEIWDCPKGEVLEKKGMFRQTILRGKCGRSCMNFVVKNHKFCFDIPHILIVALDFFSTKHGILL